ncbi:MAG: zinc dependent phospholipase C family protein [Bacteroidia bacterium]
MKKLNCLIIASIAATMLSWGTFGHEHINRAAVLALPAPLQTFFYNHVDFITQEATVPDLRKYTLNDKAENPRHFIDLENYGGLDSLPENLEQAKKKYDEKFLNQNGILPWYMDDLMTKLVAAFKAKKKTEILFLAADMGHYMGDAHMPLHTSANYDGQMTDQKGVHALWESRLPEAFGKDYNYSVPKAKFIENTHAEFLKILKHSHQLKDTLLAVDKELRKQFGEKLFKEGADGKAIKNKYGQPVFSDEYAAAFHKALNGMVEKQMRASAEATADFWYTAWEQAGKPDLGDLDPEELTKQNAPLLKNELKLLQKGKLFGVESEKEF